MTLHIQLASFDPKVEFNTKYYDFLIENTADLLTKNGGLRHLAEFNPNALIKIMIQLIKEMY